MARSSAVIFFFYLVAFAFCSSSIHSRELLSMQGKNTNLGQESVQLCSPLTEGAVSTPNKKVQAHVIHDKLMVARHLGTIHPIPDEDAPSPGEGH